MNTQGYLGLDNTYAYALVKQFGILEGPYVIDERLRETPVVPDYSFNTNTGRNTVISNYFIPLKKSRPAFIELNKEDYKVYLYLRNNAFYTPYGMMILLDNPFIFQKAFKLEDRSLIPQNRKIERIGSNINSSSYNTETYATFFADFVMEKIILKFFYNNTPADGPFSDKRNKIYPVLMKSFKPFKSVPVYDVQFHDLIAFADRTSYDTYMVALTSFLSGHMIDGDQLSFRFNPVYRLLKCYPLEHISLSLKGSNEPMIRDLDVIWDDKSLSYEEKRQRSYDLMEIYRKMTDY